MQRRQLLFDRRNGLAGVQMFGTHLGTIHNGMTTVQFKGVVEVAQSFDGPSVPTVFDPSIGLHQNGGSQILVTVPPVTGTTGTATGTQDTLVHTIQLGAVLFGLQMFLLMRGLGLCRLQPGFNGTVLFVKVTHVGDQILNDVHVGEWVYFGGLGEFLPVNVGQAREGVGPVNVHGATSTNSLPTTASKGQGGVLFIFDLDESIQDHGTAGVQIHWVRTQVRLLGNRTHVFGIPTINFEVFDAFGFLAW